MKILFGTSFISNFIKYFICFQVDNTILFLLNCRYSRELLEKKRCYFWKEDVRDAIKNFIGLKK